jgi:toxin ParE1/3/4
VKYNVLLIRDAESDLASIFDYIAEHNAVENALYILDQVERAVSSLSDLPEHGNYPKELAISGVRDYWEIFFNTYRIIYRVGGKLIYVFLVSDGRRDMQTLLQRRLLSAAA